MDSPPPPDVEVYDHFFRGRHALIEALTTDLDEFLEICDPEKECLCLSADGNKMSWDLTSPPPHLPPPDLHGPVPGVFFKREDMPLSEWLLKIALQCDTWLNSVASHRGAHLDTSAR
ncbi:hypothetical protein Scep_015179 [Stephania cephalantha]|uniref:PHD finger protein ALFIN-LIKE n=1 Tax=Stephania cephalantha TaxID=152367 RepID=A0AAP0J4M3_9MAGN